MLEAKRWDLLDWSGGLDLCGGRYSSDMTSQRVRRNVFAGRGPGESPVIRRGPCLDYGGMFDAASQGLLIYQGRFYVFCRKGDAIAHTGAVLSLVENLEFDAPEYTHSWKLLRCGVHEGAPWALIRHEGDAGSQVFIHVWDGLLYEPTYVLDPAFPANYTAGPDDLAQQQYDADFEPAAAEAVSKVWVSTLAGNVQSCRTADTRVWNQRTEDSFRVDGEHYCFRVPGGTGALRDFHVPRPASDLMQDQRWSYYVLERAIGDAWSVIPEVSTTPTANDTWQAVQVSRWGSSDVVQVRVRWGSSQPGLIRVRLVAAATQVVFIGSAPTVTYTGSGATRTVTISPYEFTYRGGDKVRSAGHSVVISQGNDYLLGVGPGGLSTWNLTAGPFPTGWEREQVRLIERIRWPGAEANPNYVTAAGTVAVSSGSPTVTGTGTAFTQEFRVGDYVLVDGQRKKITAIASDTLATAESNYSATLGSLALSVWSDPSYRYAYENAAESEWFTGITIDYFDRAGAEDAITIATRNHDRQGGLVSAIGTHLNRLVVFYPGSIQSWSVDQATNATAHLATLGFGTGPQVNPAPVLFYETVAVSLGTTVRGIFVSGPNNDTLRDNNIGEKIEGLPMPTTRASCHWVDQGELVVAATDANGDAVFLVLDYSRESKLTCWNTWDVVGLPEVDRDTLHALQDRLYFRAGNRLRYFDAPKTGKVLVYRDADEVAGAAYLSSCRTPLNLFGRPALNKQTIGMEVHASGQTHVQFELANPEDYEGESVVPLLDNLVHVGTSRGDVRLPVTLTAVALAIDLSSRDEAGWRLRGFGLDYQWKRR
jgi:hypothetical protein